MFLEFVQAFWKASRDKMNQFLRIRKALKVQRKYERLLKSSRKNFRVFYDEEHVELNQQNS